MKSEIRDYQDPSTGERVLKLSVSFNHPEELEFLSAILGKGLQAVNPCGLPDGGKSSAVRNLSGALHEKYCTCPQYD